MSFALRRVLCIGRFHRYEQKYTRWVLENYPNVVKTWQQYDSAKASYHKPQHESLDGLDSLREILRRSHELFGSTTGSTVASAGVSQAESDHISALPPHPAIRNGKRCHARKFEIRSAHNSNRKRPSRDALDLQDMRFQTYAHPNAEFTLHSFFKTKRTLEPCIVQDVPACRVRDDDLHACVLFIVVAPRRKICETNEPHPYADGRQRHLHEKTPRKPTKTRGKSKAKAAARTGPEEQLSKDVADESREKYWLDDLYACIKSVADLAPDGKEFLKSDNVHHVLFRAYIGEAVRLNWRANSRANLLSFTCVCCPKQFARIKL